MDQKRRFPECWCVRRRAQLSRNSGLGGRVIFPYSKMLREKKRSNYWADTGKRDFSCIFVGSPSRIFSDFRKFHVFQRFSCIVLNASRRQKHSKCVHFDGYCVDPSNFHVKIHEISMLFAKCYLNVARSAPDMKIRVFWKALPKRDQNVIFHAFL